MLSDSPGFDGRVQRLTVDLHGLPWSAREEVPEHEDDRLAHRKVPVDVARALIRFKTP